MIGVGTAIGVSTLAAIGGIAWLDGKVRTSGVKRRPLLPPVPTGCSCPRCDAGGSCRAKR